ncbi:MAG: redoxin domain-containing protein [Nitrospirae bacterium]|nr:redoxin domain-containing protein [Nitrospirota bacterium]
MKRKHWNKILLVLFISGLLGFLLSQQGFYNSSDNVTTKLGGPAMDFTLMDIDNKEVKLSDFKGKAVMLRFWSSRCPSCKKEMPVVEKAYRKLKDKGFVVLAINIEDPKEVAAETANKLDLTFPILIDKGMSITKLYKVFATPTSFFIDKNGVMKEKVLGELSEETIAMYLEELI